MEALAESKSTNRRCSLKKGVLKYFAKFPRKTPVLESLFNKIAGLEDCNFIKKTLQHRCFPVKLAKFLRTPFFYRTPQVATSVLYESMEKVVKKNRFSLRTVKYICINFLASSKSSDQASWETNGKHYQLLAERLGEISDEYTPAVSLSTAFNAGMIRKSTGDKRKKAYAVSNQNYIHQQLTSPLRSYINALFLKKNQSKVKISKITNNSNTHNCLDKAALRQNIHSKINQHNKNETFLVKDKLYETLSSLSNFKSTDTKMEKIKTNDEMLSEYYNQGICNTKNSTYSLHDKSLTNSKYVVTNSSHETEESMNNATLATALSQLTFWNISNVDDDPSCRKSDVLRNVTLKGGLHSGSFKDRGQMEDIKQCVRLCCLLQKCDLAFMLSNTCFSVECVSDALCEAVPARSNVFSPTICYVYRKGDSKGGSKTL